MTARARKVHIRDDVVLREEDEGAFLFDPVNGRLCYLNQIGIDILKMCRQPVAENDIVNALAASYPEAPPKQIAADCGSFLEELNRLGFTENEGGR